MLPIISASLGNYYDSRKNFDSNTNTWYDITSVNNLTTYNTSYTASKSLLFGASFLLPTFASASFYGIEISSSFAMEFWIAPFTSSTAETIVSTIPGSY